MALADRYERWITEGWKPFRIGWSVIGGIALVVTLVGYVTHPHHPGALWWLVAFFVVVSAWTGTEMFRWRVRDGRAETELTRLRPLQAALATITEERNQ